MYCLERYNVGLSDLTNIGATIVTIISMFFTIEKAREVKNTAQSFKIKRAIERLVSAQDHIRNLSPEKIKQRGFDSSRIIGDLRKDFDLALGNLVQTGEEGGAREVLRSAQNALNIYQKSLLLTPDNPAWEELVQQVQNTISKLNQLNLDE